MNEDSRVTKSFDFAADITKQLIALSTAIISLCVAFTDKIFSSEVAHSYSSWLLASLIFFVVSIILGIATLMALAGHLGKPQNENTSDSHQDQPQQADNPHLTTPSPIYKGNVRVLSSLQMLTFIIAISIAVAYVYNASTSTRETPAPPMDAGKFIKVIRVSDYSVENGHVTDTLYLDSQTCQ